jgi:hypothetical protein
MKKKKSEPVVIMGAMPMNTPIEIDAKGTEIIMTCNNRWLKLTPIITSFENVQALKGFVEDVWKAGYHQASIDFMNKKKK